MNCDQPELFIMVWTSCLWFHNTRLALAGFSSRNYNLTFRLWYLLTVSCKSVWISLVSPQILRCCNVLFPYLPEPPASFSTDVDSTTHTNCLLRSFFACWSDLCTRTEVKKKSTGIYTKHFQVSSAPDCLLTYLIPLCLCHGALQTLTSPDS